MKKIISVVLIVFTGSIGLATPSIIGVVAKQRSAADRIVEIEVQLTGSEEEVLVADCFFVASNVVANTELSVSCITKVGEDVNAGACWKRYYEWDAKADVGEVRIDSVALSVGISAGVQLWEGGPYWAECNIGATKPEEYGYYFWWGDTVGYKRNASNSGWISTQDGSVFDFSFRNCPTYRMSNTQLLSDGYIDSTGNLTIAHDAAAVHLGAPWRMPTYQEFVALFSNCTTTWTARNGVYGRLISGRGEYSSKSIFIPAAGYGDRAGIGGDSPAGGHYWSSTPFSDDNTSHTWCVLFGSSVLNLTNDNRRYFGWSVRPVRVSGKVGDLSAKVISTSFTYEGRLIENPVISPETRTIFSTSLTISILCASDGSVIHYTTDGSEPTMESPEYKRFRITGKTTVKARAFFENGNGSEVVTAEYALGQCPDPVISTTGGETFYHKGNQVSIAYDCEEGVVHYTTDGSEPTAESPVYEGPFTTDESMVVKAKAFSDNYFDSAVVTATLTREWEQVATPVITAAESFTGAKTKVEIVCATEGTTIRYTLNGNIPNSHSTEYTAPFFVTESCVIKAYAVLDDYTNSEIAAKTIMKVWGIGDSVALPDQTFTTSGDAGWVDANGEAMKSGAITDNQKSILSTTFVGKGVLSFKWKVSCEDDEKDSWDHAAFLVDGAEIKRQDGISDWLEISHSIETDGSHTVEWVYVKDDAESDNDDCIWLKDIVWMPEKTQTSEVKVETEWLKEKYPTLGNYYFDYEEKASETAANGINKIWEAYLIGLDPTDSAAKFVSSIAIEDGKPVVAWSPDLGEERVYKILGSTDLKTWDVVAEGEETNYNFFKVSVEMK